MMGALSNRHGRYRQYECLVASVLLHSNSYASPGTVIGDLRAGCLAALGADAD